MLVSPDFNQLLGAMACACHHKICRRLRWKGLQFQISQGKKVCKTPSQQKKLGMVSHACYSSNARKGKQKDCDPDLPGQKTKPYLHSKLTAARGIEAWLKWYSAYLKQSKRREKERERERERERRAWEGREREGNGREWKGREGEKTEDAHSNEIWQSSWFDLVDDVPSEKSGFVDQMGHTNSRSSEKSLNFVYGILVQSSRVGGQCEPVTYLIFFTLCTEKGDDKSHFTEALQQ
jgi:hypothetical protein